MPTNDRTGREGRSTAERGPTSRPAAGWSGLLAAAVAVSLVGCKKDGGGASTSATAAATCATCVVADERGFIPSSIDVPAGAAGEMRTLTFMRTSDETCATEVVFPDLNIKKELPLKQPVTVSIPAGDKRTYTFTCGMGMYKSAIVVK